MEVKFRASFYHYDSIKIDVNNNSARIILETSGTEIAEVAKLLLLHKNKIFEVKIKELADSGTKGQKSKDGANEKKTQAPQRRRYKG